MALVEPVLPGRSEELLKIRDRRIEPGVRPARIIDPTTKAVIGYMDPLTRGRWADQACTIPMKGTH